jgi:hypothetical protein
VIPLDRIRARAAAQDGLITTAQAKADGLDHDDVKTLRRRDEWRALARGVYLVDADMYGDALPDRVWWQTALLTHGDQFCLVAVTAVLALGLVGPAPGGRGIEIARIGGASRSPHPTASRVLDGGREIVVRQLPVRETEVIDLGGLRVRNAFHSVIDAALVVDRPTALSLLDSALHTELLDVEDRPKRRGRPSPSWHRRGPRADSHRRPSGRVPGRITGSTGVYRR